MDEKSLVHLEFVVVVLLLLLPLVAVRNPIQESIMKHKKKLFKITFMDKGMKKKGTAVSHKGVMRIVSGKSNFKVYDEKNHDVTSQFRTAPKK